MIRGLLAWVALLIGIAVASAPFAPAGHLGRGAGSAFAPPPGALASAPSSTPFSPWAGRARVGEPPRPTPPVAGPPLRLLFSALPVDAPVVPVDVAPDGSLDVPADPALVGWWRAGSRPGSATGTVVLAGHVDTDATGPGALFRLADARPGDRVVVATAGGGIGYEVQAVRRYAKARLPADTFATDGRPRLVLITCGGAFDRRSRGYADNVVVYAVPVEGD